MLVTRATISGAVIIGNIAISIFSFHARCMIDRFKDRVIFKRSGDVISFGSQ